VLGVDPGMAAPDAGLIAPLFEPVEDVFHAARP